eukprot:CAMPEP_0202706388 /NCGR_PEP_ID=MMETSP1385-20130828/18812_1 /ASSEMBLY_ACC=CAM_ASM_000861 /TAXON_ID=933848 /ORGANISM="Elphidium margaritaceum" /LENGTH=263 /DNA_ID=CAMNT_0049364843 /DNA_START=19 /DNA_END=810 /DNA_ORIENTATION=-
MTSLQHQKCSSSNESTTTQSAPIFIRKLSMSRQRSRKNIIPAEVPKTTVSKSQSLTCLCGQVLQAIPYHQLQPNTAATNDRVEIHCDQCLQSVSNQDYVYQCSDHDRHSACNFNICKACVDKLLISTVISPVAANASISQSKFKQEEKKLDNDEDDDDAFMASFKTGHMYKKGGYNRAWKERYFELNGVLKTLTYYAPITEQAQKYKVKGFIDFRETPIVQMMKSASDQFHVVTAKREWVFKCVSKRERDDWYDIIMSLCAFN